jgi:hypothetical protein
LCSRSAAAASGYASAHCASASRVASATGALASGESSRSRVGVAPERVGQDDGDGRRQAGGLLRAPTASEERGDAIEQAIDVCAEDHMQDAAAVRGLATNSVEQRGIFRHRVHRMARASIHEP